MSDKQARVGRYAQAIFQLMVEKWQSELGAVADLVSRDPELTALLADTARDAAQKIAGLDAALAQLQPQALSAEVANFARLLVQEGDFALLPQVATGLAQVASGRTGPTKAEVTSAVELSPQEQEEIRRKLVQEHGDGLAFHFAVDPSLMGGLRVRVGDTLIDTSVASRLARLRESLASVVR